MADKWFAECLPCKWEKTFDSQDEAITAANDHVLALHASVPSQLRAQEKIGHVQLRSEDAHTAEQLPADQGEHGPHDAGEDAHTAEQLPAGEDQGYSHAHHGRHKGKHESEG